MKYTVTGTAVTFGIGQRLKLSAAQIDARRHVLEIDDEDKGSVMATGLVTFKRGEELGLEDKPEELPRTVSDVLTPSSSVPSSEKRKSDNAKSGKAKSGKAKSETPDLDELEARLERAEKAFKDAMERHGISIAKEPTAEQRELIKAELDELRAAKLAYDEAVGD
ncbi:hypothetical protein [Rhizobium mongolense]|uniref:Uncharacterized protein n=1 Tax=Rhizobium mongolense TaxID=57676 RepID=A0A7W6RQY3_9HYPH|nr:hypothetical protein [Rhizobium mongolense]MBB4277030.1 hypothetical protein [Rhizobium mongolense]